MVFGQTSLQHLKNGPFSFFMGKVNSHLLRFSPWLPTAQISRISEPVRQNGLITQQFQLWPLGNTQCLDDIENLMGCLSSLHYTGSGERSYFNFYISRIEKLKYGPTVHLH